MDREWAMARLTDFIEAADEFDRTRHSHPDKWRTHKERLEELTPACEAIIKRVYPGLKVETLLFRPVGGGSRSYTAEGGRLLCTRTLQELRSQQEIRERLGPTGPVMRATGLHSMIWDAASRLWDGGHHRQAVQRAATFLNAHVQDRAGRHDVSDKALMQAVFSADPPKPEAPRLRWPGGFEDLTVKAMNDGIRNYAVGCFLAIRNTATHETDDLDPQVALEQLAALSVLARWVDECELVLCEPV